MLGKLFNLGAGTGALPSSQTPSPRPFPLESVQEDIHTRHLLFPDPQDLYEHRANQLYPLSSGATTPTSSSANAFDYNADIELDVRDVRIIIMQDALSSVAASLLYDSQPPPPVPAASVDRPSATAGSYSVQEPRRTPAASRKPSLGQAQRPIVIQPGTSPRTRHGVFDRRPSIHSRNQAHVESESQRAWREYREELATFSSCIFGNSELMAYKGTSTKVHVVPSDLRATENASAAGDGRGSMGRSSMRAASRLSQSFSSENPPPFTTPPQTPGGLNRTRDRKTVLITRLFPVNLPLEEDVTAFQGALSEEPAGYPFPKNADDPNLKKFQPKQKRTPMYAVALIITLPPSPSHTTPAATLRSGFRGPGSYVEQDSFPSSFGSTRRSGWTLVGQGPFPQDSFDSSFGSDMEDQIDAITQHWDIIMRALSHLQSVVAGTLFAMLRQADLASPDPRPTLSLQMAARGGKSVSGRRSEDGPPVKPPKTNAKHITLLPNCLLDNRRIATEIDEAKTRIVAGIRACRVTTGQNRWPIWREEARWVAKWAGGKEQDFFFYSLLTRFLATHTDWLQALSPPAYRRRYFVQQKARSEEDLLVPARTIIVSDDKIAARRLLFLLAAFLPASQQLPGFGTHRPSTPASLGALSQSPPSLVVPILKEESLRRKINRRTSSRMPSHSRNLSLQSHSVRASGVPPPLAHLSMENRHERRASDAASIRTSHLPIRGGDPNTRKSSAATTATITPETSIPHFATLHRAAVLAQGRPGSSTSVAADDLKRLARDDSPGSRSSAAGERRQSSTWSVISGLWNPRRRDSTSKAPTPNDGQGGAAPSLSLKAGEPSGTTPPPPKTSSEAGVPPPATGAAGEQATAARRGSAAGHRDPTPSPRASADTARLPEQTGVAQKAQRIPDPSGAFESPVKTSINLNDGVIDVDVPLPDFITSFESAVSSPSSSGYLSASGFGTGLDAFEQSYRFSADGDVPLNVAGWLQSYHPDFVLQAVPPQHDLIEQIKASMRAEPTPPVLNLPSTPASEDSANAAGKWVDITSAVVADTTTFTITRICYRRLLRPRRRGSVIPLAPTTTTTITTTTTTPSNTSISTHNNPAAAAQPSSRANINNNINQPYEVQMEYFIEEPVVTFDEVLVEAVEKVIATAGCGGGKATAVTPVTTSKVSSASSSRSTSKQRRERGTTGVAPGSGVSSDAQEHQHHHPPFPHGGVPAVPQQPQEQEQEPEVQQEVPRSQCKTVLLSALEDIIHDVIAEREQEHREHELELDEARERKGEHDGNGHGQGRGRGQGQGQYGAGRGGEHRIAAVKERERERESPLREAVRCWIESVDLGGGGGGGGGGE